MKKTLSLVLCMLLVLTIFGGCGPQAGAGETTAEATQPDAPVSLSVGFGRADITPTEPTPLGGLRGDRFSEDVMDRLYAACIAFTDQTGTTVLLFSVDLLSAFSAVLFGGSDVAKATGVPFENIILATTHSHSAPDMTKDDLSIQNYTKLLRSKMVEAAQAALADRQPATMSINTAYPENVNFIRHYRFTDGTYGGDNFGSFSGKTIAGHVREVDNALQMVKFTREDAKNIIMLNWQGHPDGHGSYRNSILSFSGSVTDQVEAGLNCHCLYVLGASGNVNNASRIKEEQIYKDYREKTKVLADAVINAESSYQEVSIGKIQILAKNESCTTKTSSKMDVPLDTYAIGDVALAAAPYEMFCENGQAIKSGSPYKMTFVSTCTNTRLCSYVPSVTTYDYNNMPDEVFGISQTPFVKGAAEILQDSFISMLNQMYNSK